MHTKGYGIRGGINHYGDAISGGQGQSICYAVRNCAVATRDSDVAEHIDARQASTVAQDVATLYVTSGCDQARGSQVTTLYVASGSDQARC